MARLMRVTMIDGEEGHFLFITDEELETLRLVLLDASAADEDYDMKALDGLRKVIDSD